MSSGPSQVPELELLLMCRQRHTGLKTRQNRTRYALSRERPATPFTIRASQTRYNGSRKLAIVSLETHSVLYMHSGK